MASQVTEMGLRAVARAHGVDVRDVLRDMAGEPGKRLLASMGERRRDWYRLENKDPDHAVLHLYDEIGWYGTQASDFVAELNKLDVDRLTVRINSIGGSVFDGIAIFNALRTSPARVDTVVDSAALSIASVIVQAGDTRTMVAGSQMMIHPAWGLAVGDAKTMREYADLLDFQTKNIKEIYEQRAGSDADFGALMDKETWFTPDGAREVGLVDKVLVPAVQPEGEPADASDPGLENRWREFVETASQVNAR